MEIYWCQDSELGNKWLFVSKELDSYVSGDATTDKLFGVFGVDSVVFPVVGLHSSRGKEFLPDCKVSGCELYVCGVLAFRAVETISAVLSSFAANMGNGCRIYRLRVIVGTTIRYVTVFVEYPKMRFLGAWSGSSLIETFSSTYIAELVMSNKLKELC